MSNTPIQKSGTTLISLVDRPSEDRFPVREDIRNSEGKTLLALGLIYEATGFPVDILEQIQSTEGKTIPVTRLSLPVPWAQGLGEWSRRVYEVDTVDADVVYRNLAQMLIRSMDRDVSWTVYGKVIDVQLSPSRAIRVTAALLENSVSHFRCRDVQDVPTVELIRKRRSIDG